MKEVNRIQFKEHQTDDKQTICKSINVTTTSRALLTTKHHLQTNIYSNIFLCTVHIKSHIQHTAFGF